MRILSIFGICLLIVTMAVGADARDRGSRDSNNSSASSRDSRSSSDHQSGGSGYRPSSQSNSADRGSAPSYNGGRPSYSGYHPDSAINRNDSAPGSPSSGGSKLPGFTYRPSDNARSEFRLPSSDNRQDNKATPNTSTDGRGAHNIYSGYRVDRGDSTQPVTSRASVAYVPNMHNAYRQDMPQQTNAADGHAASRIGENPVKPMTDHGSRDPRNIYSNYSPGKPDDASNSVRQHGRPDMRQGDQSRNHDGSGYKPAADHQAPEVERPSMTYLRQKRVADALAAPTHSYRPAVTKPHFTYANYRPPTGYRPPTYREGHYFYSHPNYTRPCSFGFWSFDYYSGFSRRSIYFHYGFFPYIEVTRIIVDSYPEVVYVDQPIYTNYGVRYQSDRYPGLDDALADIRSAWVSGRYDLIESHVRDCDIAVLLDGKYDYSVASDDYLSMTQDALGQMDTISFVWNKVQQRTNGTVTAFATHTYRSGDSEHKVYVSYTLQKIGGCYYIVEVGSAQVPWN